jgi:hypothetical protein
MSIRSVSIFACYVFIESATAVLPGAGGEGGGQAPGGQVPQVDAAFETGARVPPGPNARLPITLPALGTGSVPVSRLAATSHT